MNDKLLLDTNVIIYYFNGIITDNRIDKIFKVVVNDIDAHLLSKIEELKRAI